MLFVPRSVDEWRGANPDAAVPPRVRLRVFERAGGRCELCSRLIRAGTRWITDHILALINGGENRESNLQCICDWCDRNIKTPGDVAEKARTYRKKAKHLGIKATTSRPMPGSKASGWKQLMSGQWIRREKI